VVEGWKGCVFLQGRVVAWERRGGGGGASREVDPRTVAGLLDWAWLGDCSTQSIYTSYCVSYS
jgi:hypothetical protein